MNKLLAAAILGVASSPAQAICIADAGHTYGSELDAADHVFVATITKATLATDPAQLQSRSARRSLWVDYKIDYDYAVMAVLKGDPTAVGRLAGGTIYDKPDGRDMQVAEGIPWQPGDVVLVVAKGAGPALLSFCGPSMPFDWALSNLREEGRHDLDRFLDASK